MSSFYLCLFKEKGVSMEWKRKNMYEINEKLASPLIQVDQTFVQVYNKIFEML